MIRIRILPVTIAAIAAIGLLDAVRPIAPEPRSFVYVENNDSGGGETFTRSAGSISGDMLIGKNHAHYEGRIAADGTIPRLEIRASHSGGGAQTSRLVSVIVGRDGAELIEHVGSKVDTLRLPSRPGAIPVINPAIGLIELVVAHARSETSRKPRESRSAKIPIVMIDVLNLDVSPTAPLRLRADTGTVDATFMSADTVRFGYGRSKDQLRVVVGADGRIRGAVSGSTAKDRFSALPTSKRVPPG